MSHRWRKLPPTLLRCTFVKGKPEGRRASCRVLWRPLSCGLRRGRCTRVYLQLVKSGFLLMRLFARELRFSYLLFCIQIRFDCNATKKTVLNLRESVGGRFQNSSQDVLERSAS